MLRGGCLSDRHRRFENLLVRSKGLVLVDEWFEPDDDRAGGG
jgi:hypothetical protein